MLLLKSVAGNPGLLHDLYRWSGDFQEILDGPNGVPDLITCLTYIETVGDVPADGLRDLFTNLGPKAEEAYMTTAEQLRTEGRTEGEAMGRADALLDLLAVKFGSKSMPSAPHSRVSVALGFRSTSAASITGPPNLSYSPTCCDPRLARPHPRYVRDHDPPPAPRQLPAAHRPRR